MAMPQLTIPETVNELVALRAASGHAALGVLLERLMPASQARTTPLPERHTVTDHALLEFRKKFPRYTRPLEDDVLMDDIVQFMSRACVVKEDEEGRQVNVCHLPIWDRMKVVRRLDTIVTVSRRQKELEPAGSKRAAYGVLLGQQLLKWDWDHAVQCLCRFEYANSKAGWGLVLTLKEGPFKPLGVYWTTHELLDFYAYKNFHGPLVMGESLAYLASRLKLPEVVDIGSPDGFKHQGLYADPPAPQSLRTETLNALIRRMRS